VKVSLSGLFFALLPHWRGVTGVDPWWTFHLITKPGPLAVCTNFKAIQPHAVRF